MIEELVIDNISIFLTRKNIKNMYLRVKPPNGEVHLSAPIYLSNENIVEFIKSKKEWIIQKQKYICNNNIEAPLKYIDGETHYLWGEKYILKLIPNNKLKNTTHNKNKQEIYLPVPKKSNIEKREKILMEFYKNQVKKAIPKILNKYTEKIKQKPVKVNVRKMKNWGNCKKNRTITLNTKLAKKDPICLEYVIIHELCHLIEFNHSKNFKKLLEKHCPNWKKIEKKLNEKD